MNTLKRVSGRLKELIRGRQKAAPVETNGLHLLVVDDEESIRFSMGEYFSSHGFKVDTARALQEAETLIKLTDYKVIIQDLQLGFKSLSDGIEVIRFAHEWNPDTRIIVLTSHFSADIEEQARRAGADAFLLKPKPLSQVAQVVQGLIESPRKRVASV
jgi:two-component system, NtrC family, nitrogen regulation response regulator NtrX